MPKSDTQVKRLLATREDVFFEYDKKNFEKQFEKFFNILDQKEIKESERTIYYMENKISFN